MPFPSDVCTVRGGAGGLSTKGLGSSIDKTPRIKSAAALGFPLFASKTKVAICAWLSASTEVALSVFMLFIIKPETIVKVK